MTRYEKSILRSIVKRFDALNNSAQNAIAFMDGSDESYENAQDLLQKLELLGVVVSILRTV